MEKLEGQKKKIEGPEQACFKKPTRFRGFGKTIDYIVCFDENGSSANLKRIAKLCQKGKPIPDEIRYFTLTGCLFSKDDFQTAAFLLRILKKQYWRNEEKDVLFHSRDIRKKDKHFFLPDNQYESFIQSLSAVLDLVSCKVFPSPSICFSISITIMPTTLMASLLIC